MFQLLEALEAPYLGTVIVETTFPTDKWRFILRLTLFKIESYEISASYTSKK